MHFHRSNWYIGIIIDSDWAFDVVRGSTVPPDDFGVVAVVDGRESYLSP